MPDTTYRIHRYPTRFIESLVLANGRRVTLRPVLPQDDALEQQFVSRLSPATRRMRFHGSISGLAAAQAARMSSIDYRQELALVVTALEDDDASGGDSDGGIEAGDGASERLVADARYVRCADGCSAEFAIVVADDWAGLGLAHRLLAALCDGARRGGLRWLRGEVLADNSRMLSLMQACGFCLRTHPDDTGLVIAERQVGDTRSLRCPDRDPHAAASFARRGREWLRSLRWLLAGPHADTR